MTEPTASRRSQPAAFLDRDGVINVDNGYTYLPGDLVLTARASDGIRLLNEAGYLVIVVTNQSGVARGLYGEAEVRRFHAHLADVLTSQGARIDAFYYAPYHPDGSIARFAIDHEDRKPRAGMLRTAMREWSIRQNGSFLIGDKSSDIEAAAAVGLPALLVETNTGDLLAAASYMLSMHHHSVPA